MQFIKVRTLEIKSILSLVFGALELFNSLKMTPHLPKIDQGIQILQLIQAFKFYNWKRIKKFLIFFTTFFTLSTNIGWVKKNGPVLLESFWEQKRTHTTQRILYISYIYILSKEGINSFNRIFFLFSNPSLNSEVTIILVAQSLFQAVHGLQSASVVLFAW